MKKGWLVKGATFAFLMGAGSLALANECGLNASQLANGWQCVQEFDTTTVTTYEQNGNSHMCKVFESEVSVVRWAAYNPAENFNEGHSTAWEPVGDPSDPVKVGGNVVCPT